MNDKEKGRFHVLAATDQKRSEGALAHYKPP